MLNSKEVSARFKINRLSENSGWRFFDNKDSETNVCLEQNVKISHRSIDLLDKDLTMVKNNFTKNGKI
jgi:type I restriction enzyme, R subunit